MPGVVASFDMERPMQLVTLIRDVFDAYASGQGIDVRAVAQAVGEAFGTPDIDRLARDRFRAVLEEGLKTALDDEASERVAKIVADCAESVMQHIFAYCQGKVDRVELMGLIDSICRKVSADLECELAQELGLPPEAVSHVAKLTGIPIVSIYCFAAAYRIYRTAAEDARLAHERRLEVEWLCAESIRELKARRDAMEELVDAFMLDRLVPFRAGLAAMDQAVLAGDDDGYIAANAELWSLFGREARYGSAREFEGLMLSDDVFIL